MDNQNDLNIESNENPNKRKRKLLLLLVKIFLILAVAGGIFYVIYFTASVKQTGIILSNSEINNHETATQNVFKVGNLVYFFTYTDSESFNSPLLEIKMDMENNEEYIHYRKITYEIKSGSKSFSAVIPRSYMTEKGKFRISVLINGEMTASQNIVIE